MALGGVVGVFERVGLGGWAAIATGWRQGATSLEGRVVGRAGGARRTLVFWGGLVGCQHAVVVWTEGWCGGVLTSLYTCLIVGLGVTFTFGIVYLPGNRV